MLKGNCWTKYTLNKWKWHGSLIKERDGKSFEPSHKYSTAYWRMLRSTPWNEKTAFENNIQSRTGMSIRMVKNQPTWKKYCCTEWHVNSTTKAFKIMFKEQQSYSHGMSNHQQNMLRSSWYSHEVSFQQWNALSICQTPKWHIWSTNY